MKTMTILAALFALLVVACGGDSGAVPSGSWQLESGTFGGSPVPVVDTHPVTMTIDGTLVSGTAACNTYQGRVQVSGNSLTVADLAATEMACLPQEVMDSEAAFLAALADVRTFTLDSGRLVLEGPRTELVFRSVSP